MAKKKKYLVDTSAVRPALGHSTPKHCEHFREQAADGELWTSLYVRMEFIRVWFCEAARLAFSIAHFDDVAQALIYLEQEFSPRRNKATVAVVAFLQQHGPLRNTRQAAEECASLAIGWLAHFDGVFQRRTQNNCRCQLGGRDVSVDYNHILLDLQAFYVAFQEPVTDCEVNDFLALGRPKGKAQPLLGDQSAAKLPVVKNLQDLQDKGTHITCKECKTIGDAVIVLDTPPSWSILHTDASFNDLCPPAQREHKHIQSVRAFDKELHRELHPRNE